MCSKNRQVFKGDSFGDFMDDENKPIENIEKILMKDDLFREHFIEKLPAKYEYSGKINPAFLGINSSLDYALSWFKDYTGFPLLKDNFVLFPNGHILRREWRTELITRYGKEAEKFFKENKLRRTISLLGLNSASSFIDSDLGGKYPIIGNQAKELMGITDEHLEDYLQMNQDEKITLIRELEDKVHEFVPKLCIY
jgi:hypothetical protein